MTTIHEDGQPIAYFAPNTQSRQPPKWQPPPRRRIDWRRLMFLLAGVAFSVSATISTWGGVILLGMGASLPGWILTCSGISTCLLLACIFVPAIRDE